MLSGVHTDPPGALVLLIPYYYNQCFASEIIIQMQIRCNHNLLHIIMFDAQLANIVVIQCTDVTVTT